MKKQRQKLSVLATRREVMIAVLAAYPGGRECVASRLGLTLKRLDNHVYGNSGASPLTDEQITLLESETGTNYLPDYIAAQYNGLFVPVPAPQELDNLELYKRSTKTSMLKGEVDRIIYAALEDGVVDEDEIKLILATHHKHMASTHAEVNAVIQLHHVSAKGD